MAERHQPTLRERIARIQIATALVLAALTVACEATAQTAPSRTPTELDAVTVTGTRSERAIRDVPATVTVIDADEIERRNVQNIRDLVRYEPGVSVGNSPTRAGRAGYTIRGIGENRVLVTIDGVRVPDAPANSQPGGFTRDYVDLESIKRVEILRGPASALYGSDAIGGVVAYVTKDPADYLGVAGKNWFVSGKAAYDSVDRSFAETATAAARLGKVETLVLFTRRDGHEVENNSSRSANPQKYYVNNALAKIVWRPSESDRFRLIADVTARNVDTDIRSDRSATVIDSRGEDETLRGRLSLDHLHESRSALADRVRWIVSAQAVDRDEHSEQRRRSGLNNLLRVTDQSFKQEIYDVDLQLEKAFDLAGVPNRLVYGVNVDFTQSRRPRDRTEYNLTTGAVSKTIAGETFPNKTFPDSRSILGGIYAQNEASFLDGQLSLLPALRVDYYRLRPSVDSAFLANNPPNAVGTVSEAAVSPKFGAVLRLDDTYSVFAQYGHGFRAPPYDDANIGFTNFAFGYQILANPNLKPETSDGIEIGLRGRFADGSSFSVGAFYTLYKNFIEQRQVGVGPSGLLLFQSRNLDRVTIYGAEAKGEWRLAERFSLIGALAYAEGKDAETNQPVDSIDPFKAVLGLRYDDPRDWGVELIGTAVARKDRVSDSSFVKPDGYVTLDLIGYWRLGDRLAVNAGVFNIFDRRYFNPQDVVGVAASNPLLDLFTAPGRSFAANLVLRW